MSQGGVRDFLTAAHPIKCLKKVPCFYKFFKTRRTPLEIIPLFKEVPFVTFPPQDSLRRVFHRNF